MYLLLVNFPTATQSGVYKGLPKTCALACAVCPSSLPARTPCVPTLTQELVTLGLLLGRLLESVQRGEVTQVGPASQAKSQVRCLSPTLPPQTPARRFIAPLIRAEK